ncbi:MAG: hypothetical protein IKT27_02765, partial [Clostridia bacterium]|nr:hypothetical protein [Clostridia bacterium]
LSLVDLQAGDQPLSWGTATLVANGEIYNDLSLRQQFKTSSFKTNSDCESILAAWQHYGTHFLHHLRGMYAFALYDSQYQTAFLACDPFGIKPLYYTSLTNGVAFASEPSALLAADFVPRALDITRLSELLQLQFTTGAQSIFPHIYRVLPGEMITITQGSITAHSTLPALPIVKKTDFFNKKIENNNIFFENNKNLSIEKIAEEKYFFIENLVSCKRKKRAYGDEVLDKFFLNKWLAIPLFFLILIGVFYLTFFSVGAFLSDTLSSFVQGWLGGVALDFVRSFCSVPWVLGLIEDGLFAGVGSLVAFLPQVVLLFLFLAVLENTGYFSRVAFVFDDLFSSLGLSGKSVYTLLMGFGCSASAVVTARTLDSENARIKTTLMTPYMSCSAKLPVYAVLGGAFFGASNVFVVFLLYIIGVFVALFVGVMLDFFGLKNKESAFILEFPPYRFPDFKKVCKIAWLNLKLFVVKITTIFISMSVIVWCLGSFDFAFNYVAQSGGKSILQVLGEWLAPIFAPLGFGNWGAVSALIAGLVAKEVIVSSIAIFNGINSFGDASGQKLSESLMSSQSAVWFTPASALSFMSYALVYSPCLATMAIMKKEIGWKWTLIGIAIQLVVAYIVAFIVFNIFNLMEVV